MLLSVNVRGWGGGDPRSRESKNRQKDLQIHVSDRHARSYSTSITEKAVYASIASVWGREHVTFLALPRNEM